MQLLQKLLNKFNGLYYKQDYLCLAKETFERPLFAYIVLHDRLLDITNHHLFVGYSPLIFAIRSSNEIQFGNEHQVYFVDRQFHPNGIINEKDAIAKLSFQKIRELNSILFYEGQKADHSFISNFQQSILDWQNRLYNKKPGNVYLPGNLLKQVQVAYSIPRTISLITVSDGQLYNLFPTDLHGQIDEEHYIVSLRQKGKAAKQVESAKKIVVSEIHSSEFKTAYSLGKNHMQELKPKVAFSFVDKTTEKLHLPLPNSTTFYRELDLYQSFEHGIHRIFLFTIINKKRFDAQPSTLAHIHNVYATWRRNKGLPGNYLLR